MEDERLIELVRENRVLYDLSHAKYMDVKYKTILWNKIGAQIKLDGETCKTRWNNIRDNYRKSLKKTGTKSGQKRTNVKLYKYHEQLSFLKKYFIERSRKESVDPQEEDLELRVVEEDEEVNQTQNFAPNSTTPLPDVSTPTTHIAPTPSPIYVLTPSPSPVPIPSPSPTPSPNQVSTPSQSKKKKGKNIPQKSAASSLMEYIIQKNQERTTHTQHPVDAFLNGIAPTLKNLNPYYLHLAKSEIFATVQKYELKMMTDSVLPSCSSVTLHPGVDVANLPPGTVLLQTGRSTPPPISLSNTTIVNSQGNAPHVDMPQSIINSTTLASVTDNTTQHSNVLHNFIRNYSDTE